jgi:hypothetical protein
MIRNIGSAMMRYVHIFLFACPGCNFPVIVNRVIEGKMDAVDDGSLQIDCGYCGLKSGAVAAAAKKHFVEEWPD